MLNLALVRCPSWAPINPKDLEAKCLEEAIQRQIESTFQPRDSGARIEEEG